MKKPTATFWVFLFFLLIGAIGQVWAWNGGAEDGALLVRNWFGGIGIGIAILSKLLGGAWFTDNANGH